jgi:phosphoribosylformylglycinamidine synthase PurS subunit
MKFKTRIEVRLKRDTIDPEGETIKRSLIDLNFPVLSTKLCKVYELDVEAKTKKDAESLARLMCSRLLANPVKDEFEFLVEEDGSSPVSSQPSS